MLLALPQGCTAPERAGKGGRARQRGFTAGRRMSKRPHRRAAAAKKKLSNSHRLY
jgi:hypothetical protein